MGFNNRQIEAVKYVKKNGKITNKEYQGILKVSRITATRDLTDLVTKSILKSSESKGAGSYYTLVIAS
jgi:ATP-dependent DNA helicase RecG